MVNKIKRILYLYMVFVRANLISRMMYRGGFLLIIATSGFDTALSLIFIDAVYGHVVTIGDWNHAQALVIIATSALIDGLSWMTVRTIIRIDTRIRNGQFDFFLIRPVDAQILATIRQIDLEDISRVIFGLALLVYAVRMQDLSLVSLLPTIPLYVIMIFNALVVFYSFLVIIKSIAFWTVQTERLSELTFTFIDTTYYPMDIFRRLGRVVLTLVIPVAVIATFPARVLLGRDIVPLFILSCLVALLFALVSRKIWNISLRRYSSASS
jgi:ABC-2 type transport system permease protein